MKKLLLFTLLIPAFGFGQISMNATGSYSQNFDGLASTGTGITWTDNSTIANWYDQRSGSGSTYNAGDGTSNSGALYSFGTTGATERALGSVGSGTPGNFAHGVQLQNTSTGLIDTLKLGYTLEEWRDGGNATPVAQSLTFYYKIASTVITSLNPNVNTGWTQVTALTASSPVYTATASALDGNAAANRVVVALTDLGVTLQPGEYIMLKWEDPNNAGNDHGLAIDDVTITWHMSCNSSATISPISCGSYTVPSGDEMYSVSGTYYDTIQNHAGCDSLLTINLTITTGTITYYQDLDLDGYGNPDSTIVGCTQPTGYVTNNTDCDDSNASIGIATTVFYIDVDNDGYGSTDSTVVACVAPTGFVSNSLDCNDSISTIHPGATEIMDNGIDEDCNGSDLQSIGSIIGQYEFTGAAACPVIADTVTLQPAYATFSTFTSDSTTCAAAANVFNNSGWNTDSIVDLIEYNQFYVNAAACYSLELNRLIFTTRISSTGGTPTVIVRSSLDNFTTDLGYAYPTSSYLTDTVDLPAAFDAVDSVTFRFYVINMGSSSATFRMDNVILIGNYSTVAPQAYFADADADGYGNPADSVMACSAPAGYVADNTDCDDNDVAVNPAVVWFQDTDNDGFGDVNSTTTGCTAPTGYVADSTDCDDASASVYPGATEIADNGIDENCDGVDGYLGISNLSVNSFEVYPNPSAGMFTVVVKNEGSAVVSLVNLNGQLLKSFTSSASEFVVDATDLANGTYLMLVKSANGTSQKRIVVQH